MMDPKRLPTYHVFNRHKELVTSITSHDSASITWKWEGVGSGTVSIPGRADPDLLVPALKVHQEPLFISVYTPARFPWTGRVSNGEYFDDGDGPTLDLTLVNDKVWMDAMLAVANPAVTPALQDRESDVLEGPLETIVKRYIKWAVYRLKVPVVVAPAPLGDSSPIIRLSARMVTLSSLVEDTLKRYGYSITATTYRTGDPLPDSLQYQPEPGTVIIDLVKPRDNGRLLWQEEHLKDFSVSSSEGKAYRAYIGGKGEGADRPFYEHIDTARRDATSGYGLPEIYVESNDDALDPIQVGKDKLAEAAGGLSVNFTVPDGNPWLLGDDYENGDVAYARIGGELFSAQITEIELRDETDGITYTPKCGVADPARDGAVADALAKLVADIRAQNARR